MSGQQDRWDSSAYQQSAGFVPKLAAKVVDMLDLHKDDVVLDIGCGDGILDLEIAKVLAQGKGSVHGIDGSDAMIVAANELCKEAPNCTFEVLDGNKMASRPALQQGTFTKVLSNAALHWILGGTPPPSPEAFFRGVHASLAPGGSFAFEMGGTGNVAEVRTALLMAVSRRLGSMQAAVAALPWFFGDEAWARAQLAGAGFRVERVEYEWRPTVLGADTGVEGWLRVFAPHVLAAVGDRAGEREAAMAEVVEVLRHVCRTPDGGEMLSYVRLRCLATKI